MPKYPVGRQCQAEGCSRPQKARRLCNMHYLRIWKRDGTAGLPEQVKPTPAERFWAKVDKRGECWTWTGGDSGDNGYGGFWFNGKWLRASRASWELTYGRIPDGMHVLHKCDNPPCVRPDHLFVGTQACNNADRDRKGRHMPLYGERNGYHKLTDDAVRAIRRLCAAGSSQAEVAKRFGVSVTTVNRVHMRKRWAHVSTL